MNQKRDGVSGLGSRGAHWEKSHENFDESLGEQGFWKLTELVDRTVGA